MTKRSFLSNTGQYCICHGGCIKLLDDGDEDKEEQIVDLNYEVGMLREKNEQFLLLEVEVERRLNRFKLKDVGFANGGTSQDDCGSAVDNVLNGEPIRSFVEKVDSVRINEEVESLQDSGSESGEEGSSDSEKSGAGDEIKTEK